MNKLYEIYKKVLSAMEKLEWSKGAQNVARTMNISFK